MPVLLCGEESASAYLLAVFDSAELFQREVRWVHRPLFAAKADAEAASRIARDRVEGTILLRAWDFGIDGFYDGSGTTDPGRASVDSCFCAVTGHIDHFSVELDRVQAYDPGKIVAAVGVAASG